MTCSGDNGECPRPVEYGSELCFGHRWRQKMGRPINTPLRGYGRPLDVLREAFRRLEDVGSGEGADEEFDRAEMHFRVALSRYVKHRKSRE